MLRSILAESESRGIATPELDVLHVHVRYDDVVPLWLVPDWLAPHELGAIAGPGPGVVALVAASLIDRKLPRGVIRHIRQEDVAMAVRVDNLHAALCDAHNGINVLRGRFGEPQLLVAFTPELAGAEGAANALADLTALVWAACERDCER
jgi:hypothetical protein